MAKKLDEIKEEECPYELPEGWKWERLGNIADVKGGKRLPKGHCLVEQETKHPYIRVADFGIDTISLNNIKYIEEDTFSQISRYIIKKVDMYISIAGTIGKVGMVPDCLDGANLTENAAKICNINECTSAKYLMNLFKTDDIKLQINSNTKTTTQAKLALFRIENILLPLPPKETQQKIVDIISSLFAKLDIAQGKVEQVLAESENRRSAILHNAFSGKLTEKWRKENGISFDSWKIMTISDVAKVKGGKRVPKGMSLVDENTGHPYIKAGNLKRNTVVDDNMQYVPSDVLEVINNYTVKAGDIYITNVGACIGDCGIIPPKYDGANLTENAVKLTDLKCESLYLSRLLSSTNMQNYIKKSIASATLGKLSIAKINELKITVATIEEQKEIVHLLDKFLFVEDKVKTTCQSTLESIATMRKSILAKAFRGELCS